MKKILLIVTLAAVSGVYTFCEANDSKLPSLCDEWNILGNAYWDGFYHYQSFTQELTTDTIINNNRYVRIEQNGVYLGALREDDNKTIYFVLTNSDHEYTLYNFNAHVGEKLSNLWCGGPAEQHPKGYNATVKDISDGIPRIFTIEVQISENETWNIYWTEGIGMSNGPIGEECFYCTGDYSQKLLCAYDNGEQVYVSAEGEEYGCQYSSEPVFIDLYRVSGLNEWDGITGITQASRDTLNLISRDEMIAVLEGHSLFVWEAAYLETNMEVQLFSLNDNNIVYTNHFRPSIFIPLSTPASYMVVLNHEQIQGIIIGRVDFEVQAINQLTSQDKDNFKLLRNGQLLIIRDEKTYTVTGQEVK